MKKTLFVFLLLLAGAGAHAQINLYVDSSITNSGTGQSWAGAYKTLNEALNTANAGNTTNQYIINVAKGTYYPTGVQSDTNRDSVFALFRGGVKLLAGYPSGGGTRNVILNPTVLSGNIGSLSDSVDNSLHVMIIAGIAANSDSVFVDGFTITAGHANIPTVKTINSMAFEGNEGGGIFNQSITDKIRIINCIIRRNYAIVNGGGINNKGASPAIINCVVSGNKSLSRGGGMHSASSTLYVFGTTFTSNSAQLGGGAMSSYSYNNPAGIGEISNCSFTDNFGDYAGGAIYNTGSFTGGQTITNTIFTGNIGGNGGAIYSNHINPTNVNGMLYINNCTFNQNRSLRMFGGGAIFTWDNEYKVSISNSSFTGNRAIDGDGGAIYNAASQFTPVALPVFNCTFSNDTAVSGGAIYSEYHIDIQNSDFLSNHAERGGGLCIQTLSATISGCKFKANTATGAGGGCLLRAAYSYYTVLNTLFSGNTAGIKGGGIYSVGAGAAATITNVTLAGNSAPSGSAIYDSSSSQTISNSILWDGAGNSIFNFANSMPAVTYSIIEGGYTGTGNLNVNPMFVDPVSATLAPTTLGDYNIAGCSPAVEAGINIGSYTGVADLAGYDRLFGSIVDIGAYEYQDSYTAGAPITGNGDVCVGSALQLTNASTGGTWSSNNTAVATVNNNGLVTAVASGSAIISYTVSGGPGCSSTVTKNITVNPIPAIGAITGSDEVCEGASVQLSNSVAGGSWSSLNGSVVNVTAAGLATGISAGATTVIYTVQSAAGCMNSSSMPVTVNAVPAIMVLGPGYVCEGSYIGLDATVPGGVWASLNTGIAIIDNFGVVTGISPGIATINYTATGAGGCTSTSSVPVEVKPLPVVPPIGGPANLCDGASIQLTNTASGGVWASSNTVVATIGSSGFVTALDAGPVTISYTVTDAWGCTVIASHEVVVDAIPVVSAIAGATSVCKGSSTQLVNTTPGGVWSSGNPSVASVGNTGIVTGIGQGNVVISYTVTNANNCSSAVTQPMSVQEVDVSVLVNGQVLTADLSGGSYQWIDCDNNNSPIAGQTGQSFVATGTGNYAVVVTDNGCADTSDCIFVTSVGVGAPDFVAAGFSIYPNPSDGMITVAVTGGAASVIRVMDMTGRLLHEVVPAGAVSRVDLSGYASGVYLIVVVKDDKRVARQVRKL